jgi:hypothetical protein
MYEEEFSMILNGRRKFFLVDSWRRLQRFPIGRWQQGFRRKRSQRQSLQFLPVLQ